MRSKRSFFNLEALKESVERYAPLWVLCGMTRNALEAQSLEAKILNSAGGKNDAVKEILL